MRTRLLIIALLLLVLAGCDRRPKLQRSYESMIPEEAYAIPDTPRKYTLVRTLKPEVGQLRSLTLDRHGGKTSLHRELDLPRDL